MAKDTQSNVALNKFRDYGHHHGACMFYDKTKPDVDSFLTFMEIRVPASALEAYLDGFMLGKMGHDLRRLRYAKAFLKDNAYDMVMV